MTRAHNSGTERAIYERGMRHQIGQEAMKVARRTGASYAAALQSVLGEKAARGINLFYLFEGIDELQETNP